MKRDDSVLLYSNKEIPQANPVATKFPEIMIYFNLHLCTFCFIAWASDGEIV